MKSSKSDRSPNFKGHPSESQNWWNDLWTRPSNSTAGQNTTSSSIRPEAGCQGLGLTLSPTCRSWRSLTCLQQKKNSTSQYMLWQARKPQGQMASHQRLWRLGNQHPCNICTNSSAFAGKKTIFLKVCGTPSLYARRRTIAVIVTTVLALRSSVLLGRPLLEFLSAASKNLHHVFTLSPSTAYDLGALRLTWFSDYAKYRRSVGSSVCLTALRS